MSQTWQFVYRIQGTGRNESEALQDALDAFTPEPGEPESSELIDEDTHPVQRILENAFECQSYSGRSMYGKRCLGVNAESLGLIVSRLVREINDSNRDAIADAMEKIESDRLGMQMIFYFPSVPYVEEEKPEPIAERFEEDEES